MKKLKTYYLLQSQIEHAMSVTRSNRAAAEYLRVSYKLYTKFAKLYKNKEGTPLYEIHKNQGGAGVSKVGGRERLQYKLDDILLGKHPTYPREKLLRRLLADGRLEEKCNSCGFCSKRPTDFRVPLVLNFHNGNKRDYRFDNLELLCFNCYFVQVGNISSRDLKPVRSEVNAIPSTDDMLRAGTDGAAVGILTEEEKMEILKSLENL